MATSGTVTFSINRDRLIKDALIDAGVIDLEDTPESSVIEFASRKLNMLIKQYQTKGLKLWKNKEFTLFLEDGDNEYSLGPSGDHVTLSSDITKTEVKVAITGAGGSNVSIDVDSTSGFTAGDEVGIELDDGTFHWTTVVSVTDSDTLVITAGVPTGDTAAIDNDVYVFSDKLVRPLEIVDCFIRDQNSNDRPVDVISREEYYNFGNKTEPGDVVHVLFDPQTTRAKIKVYPTPSHSLDRLMGTARLPIEDVTSAAHDLDFPQEWYLPLQLGLAILMTPSSGTTSTEFQKLVTLHKEALDIAEGWDGEQNTSIRFQPARRQ